MSLTHARNDPLNAAQRAAVVHGLGASPAPPLIIVAAFPWCAAWEAELRALFDDYVAAKQSQQVLDYDDLLLYWAAMMAEPSLAAEIGARFDHVLVDEYQDTNRLQASIPSAVDGCMPSDLATGTK